MASTQIWFMPLADDCQSTYLTKFKNKTVVIIPYSRVNMPLTEHHLVIEHPSWADQRWWMNALVFKSVLKWPYDQAAGLEKVCSAFLHFTHAHLILVLNFGHGKVHFKNNCVQFWVWVNTFLKNMSHCYKIKEYYGYNVRFWGGIQRVSQNKWNQRAIKLNAWIWGFSLALKNNKLPINQP